MPRKDTPGWYSDSGDWMREVNSKLRERPTGHPEPTDQDAYYDFDGYQDPEHEPYVRDLWDDPEAIPQEQ